MFKKSRMERDKVMFLEQLAHEQSDTVGRQTYRPLLSQCQADYDEMRKEEDQWRVNHEDDGGVQRLQVRFNLGWAHVHQQVKTRRQLVEKGVALLRDLRADLVNKEDGGELELAMATECRYFTAYGLFLLKEWMAARDELTALIHEDADRRHMLRQARVLLALTDDRIRRDGWIGVGVTAALFGVVGAAVVGGVLAIRRRGDGHILNPSSHGSHD